MTTKSVQPVRLANLRKGTKVKMDRKNRALKVQSLEEAREPVDEWLIDQDELEIHNEQLRRTREELIESRDRYFRFYHFSPVGFVTISRQGIVLEANLTLAKLLGIELRALLRQPLSRFFVSGSQDDYQLYRRELLKSKKCDPSQLQMHRTGAEPFWAELESSQVQVDQEDDGKMQLSIRDISRHKQVEETLQTSHAAVKTLIDNVPAEIHVKDTEGRFLVINRTLETLFGVSSEQAKGKTSHDFFPLQLANAFERSDRQVMETGEAIQEESEEIQDNEVHHFLTVKFPMHDLSGKLAGVGAISTDITVRKLAEEALYESQDRYRRVARLTKMGHWVWDGVEDKCIYCSEELAAIYGVSVEEFLNRGSSLESDLEWFHPDDRQHCLSVMNQAIKNKTGYEMTARIVRDDGEIRYIHEVTDAILDANGKLVQVAGVLHDITEHKEAEAKARRNWEFLQSVLDTMPAAINVKDREGRWVVVNELERSMLNIGSYDVPGETPIIERLDKQYAADIRANDRQVIDTGETISFDYKYASAHTPDSTWSVTKVPIKDAKGNVQYVITTSFDITERKKGEEALSFQASHDALTGLVNRSDFERCLARALDTAHSSQDEHALCYLDLDQFKVVNDTCGHIAGDELLCQIGQLLSKSVRKHDTLARLGGDEFGVLMEHCTPEQALRVADTLRKSVGQFRFVWERQAFRIGVSIGLVPITHASESVAYILKAADSACYAAKDKGRNRVHVYHLDDTELARRHGEMQWVARIDQALEDNRLQLWSQQIVPVKGKAEQGAHFELLLRLIDERGETVPPGAFLPAAERYGLATKLDRWVVGAALDLLSRNPERLDRLHLCCINLSGTSLANEEFLEFVQERLEQSQVSARKICFEVTETAAIANLSRAITFMETLKQRGCQFALDDFGSGLSSFAYLKTLPVDYLKIDGAFVKDIVDDKVDMALVRSINDMGKVMGKRTIAEFVENNAILEKLRKIGVDYAQGYGISRPAPIVERA
jgi:diguanylate cyclase (GGDEF)-like protein/PAS domain S-box-containing protein